MKLTIPKSTLSAEISAVSSVVKSRNSLPILSYAKVDAAEDTISITATDLDCFYNCKASAVVTEPGSCLLPVAKVKEWLGIVGDGDVVLESDGQKIKLGQKRFSTEKSDDFPVMPVSEEKRIAAADFSCLKHISFAVPSGKRAESRPELAAIFFEPEGDWLIAATTNGYCCSTLKLKAELLDKEFKELSVPSHCLDIVASLGPCEMSETKNGIVFSSPSRRLVISKTDYQIPSWRKVITQHPYIGSCSVIRWEFAIAIEQCHIDRGSERGVRIEIDQTEGGMKIACLKKGTNDGFDEVIAGRTQGEFPPIAFNSEYLLPFLSLPDESLLKLEFTGEQTICHFNAGSVDFFLVPLNRRKA